MPDALMLHFEGFDGPMDLLLDLARAQKFDLARVSILSLVEQFLAVVEGARRVRLELAADWLVMAAWLAWLKSRLLLPAGPETEEAELAAESLASRLRDLQAVRALAAWLARRPALGFDVFARAAPEELTDIDRSRLAADLPGLIRAYLAALRRAASAHTYQPAGVPYWTVQDALARLSSLLGGIPNWATLERYLPDLAATPGNSIAHRAAVASTLLASLELARDGRLRLRQLDPFGPILVRAGARHT